MLMAVTLSHVLKKSNNEVPHRTVGTLETCRSAIYTDLPLSLITPSSYFLNLY